MNRKTIILEGFQNLKQAHKHAFAVLLDPDKISVQQMEHIAKSCDAAKVDYIFLGGSLIMQAQMSACILEFRKFSALPIVLFPGNPSQVCPEADALLYLSLISGRNPELLIGQHVTSAYAVRHSGLEILSTGYMLVEGGTTSTVSYMSHTQSLPHNKPDIALCTAWAGEMQGKQVIYMDAGSGASLPISTTMIEKVSQNIKLPLIVGGGISTPEKVAANCKAGAQIIVVGNALEKDLGLLKDLSAATKF